MEILQETYALGSDPVVSHLFVSLIPLRLRNTDAFSSLRLEMVCTRLLSLLRMYVP